MSFQKEELTKLILEEINIQLENLSEFDYPEKDRLPSLAVREPDKRLEKNRLKNKRKLRGKERATLNLDELLNLENKSEEEKAKTKYGYFKKWAERAEKNNNVPQAQKWNKAARFWEEKIKALQKKDE